MSSWSVVVPVKRLDRAKTRLQGALPGVEHPRLVLALTLDTVTAALRCREVSRVVVVTDDARAAGAVRRVGAEVVGDEPDAGLNPALRHGAGYARRLAPYDGVAVLSADLPALRPDELAAALDAAEPLGAWDFVSLLIGVNNQYRGRTVEEYAREFTALLLRAVGYAAGRSGRVLVLSIPDWGVTPFAVAQGRDPDRTAAELDAYNGAARALCKLHGVAFIDVTGVSRALGGAPSMLAGDGLHPSAAMYAEWTELALPVAKRLLADARA